ncbi:MAG: sulfite exporter TauE/SafE family protein [Patescibacteria group bacterium]|nr:sulfite exporter TauE/SafE family protein [Patescibacteria group bacterium]
MSKQNFSTNKQSFSPNKTKVPIKGMHCTSCEILIEDELLTVEGVQSVKMSYREGSAEICHNGNLNHVKVARAIQRVGYSIGKDKKPFFSRNIEDYKTFGIAVCLVFIFYYIFTEYKLFNISSSVSNNYSSLPIVFLVGLTAGISTCMALVGGLVLGASAKFAEKHPNSTGMQKFAPHLFFNIGRIITFFVLGGVIGMAGSVFQLSSSILGILTIIIGFVMLSLGIQLIEIFPKLSSFKFTLPKSISRLFGAKSHDEKEYSHKNSMILGGSTFFLPCGFTQAMQLFAMSTGSFWKGSLTMGIFAIGTAPGLLGIGGLTSIVRGSFASIFFKFAGVVVILLALFNISNGYNLSGLALAQSFSNMQNETTADPNVSIENGVQIVKMTQSASGYEPNTFTIKKGIPVKWVINSVDSNTCASSIVSAALNVRQTLNPGENVIEFTPNEVGQIRFSCAMGMYTGVFNVVDGQGTGASNPSTQQAVQAAQAIVQPAQQAAAGGACGSGGCGCGGGAGKAQVPQGPAVAAEQQGSVQVLKATYTLNNDIRPNNFTVKAGTPVRMEIDVKESGSGCMASIMIPRLVNQPQLLTAGQNITFNFTPQTPGDYPITCAMGIPRGSIKVN